MASAVPLLNDSKVEEGLQQITAAQVQTPAAYYDLVEATTKSHPAFLCATIEQVFEDNLEAIQELSSRDELRHLREYWFQKTNDYDGLYREMLLKKNPHAYGKIVELLVAELNFSIQDVSDWERDYKQSSRGSLCLKDCRRRDRIDPDRPTFRYALLASIIIAMVIFIPYIAAKYR